MGNERHWPATQCKNQYLTRISDKRLMRKKNCEAISIKFCVGPEENLFYFTQKLVNVIIDLYYLPPFSNGLFGLLPNYLLLLG